MEDDENEISRNKVKGRKIKWERKKIPKEKETKYIQLCGHTLRWKSNRTRVGRSHP